MGRKSALTDDQWVEVERRHLVDGQSISSLAKEFKVDQSTVRKKINPNKSGQEKAGKSLQALALRKIEVDKQSRDFSQEISQLPMARQAIVEDLARKFTNVMSNMFTAAERGSETASMLATMATAKMRRLDLNGPTTGEDLEEIKFIAGLTETANKAGHMAMTLMGAQKEEVARMSQPEVQTVKVMTLADFYGEGDSLPPDPKLRLTPPLQ